MADIESFLLCFILAFLLIYWLFLLVLPLVTLSSPLSSNFWVINPCLAVLEVSVHAYFHNCFPNPLVLLLFPPHFTSSVLLRAAAASLAQNRLNSKALSQERFLSENMQPEIKDFIKGQIHKSITLGSPNSIESEAFSLLYSRLCKYYRCLLLLAKACDP